MGYSAEVMQRARVRLAAAKADRESENRQHLDEAYGKVPRLREIDRQLRLTMAMAAQAVFTSGGDVNEGLEEAKRRNQELQRERAALVQMYFDEGYLDDSPICDRCGGSGYLGASMCECLAELCRQEQKKELTLLSAGKENFNQFRLDYYPDRYDPNLGTSPRVLMERNLKNCRNYALQFTTNSGNLLFNGGTGLGKTFLSACIARTVADRGYSVVYESAGHLFANLERAKFSGDEQARLDAKKYTDCDLLIVDDLGTEMPGQFTNAALYGLINDRLLACKPMLISTNLNVMEELPKRYSPQIVSRLQGNFRLVPFVGEDIRVKKNWGM